MTVLVVFQESCQKMGHKVLNHCWLFLCLCNYYGRDFKLLLQSRWELYSSGLLRSK